MEREIEVLRGALGAERAERFDAAEDLRAVARPRMTGGEGAEEVERGLRERFEGLGYDVRDIPFTFSTLPGRFGLTAVGVVHVLGALLAGIFLLSGTPAAAVVVLLLELFAVAAVVVLGGRAVLGLRWGRQTARNLMVTPGGERPRYLLMAHRDSKSQLVPLVLRWPAIVVAALSWVALLVVAALSIVQPLSDVLAFVLSIIAVLAGTVLTLCWASDDSPGALDNASGVAALIGIAARERERADVGFLLTDAEELGLAGARAMAGRLPPVFGVINIDGLDDEGPFYVLERFGVPRRGTAPHLALALMGAGSALDLPVTRRDVPPGLMLDHMPIVKGGMAAVTLMRGRRRSMARVHRPGDDLSRLRGDGVSKAVDLVCAALRLMRTQEPPGARRVAQPTGPG